MRSIKQLSPRISYQGGKKELLLALQPLEIKLPVMMIKNIKREEHKNGSVGKQGLSKYTSYYLINFKILYS